jgi:acyl carrier protein
METQQITERLTGTFREVFDDPNLVIQRGTTAEDVEDWDSLTHINLMVAVEREFKIKLTTAEVTGMKDVGDLIDLIAKKAA